MSAALRVRGANIPGDLDAIMAIDRVSFTNPWSRHMFEWELTNSDVSRLYVCESATGAVIGYCAVWVIFDELHINTLAVDPAWRRQGVATRLLDHALVDAASLGARRATLEVRAQNTAARRLYEQMGFTVGGIRPGYYQSPPDDALVLWKESLENAGGSP